MKRAVVLNCSCFVFFIFFFLQHLDILKGAKKKKILKIIINQQNRKKGKAEGLRGTR